MMDFFSQHWTLAIDWVSLHVVTPVVNALNIAEAAGDPREIAGADALADTLAGEVAAGDMVVCLGAGDITKWAAGLAPAISAKRGAA